MTGWYQINPVVPAALWILPLITDSIVFLLTLHRSRRYWKGFGTTPCVLHPRTSILLLICHRCHQRTIYVFARDGTMYFLVICMANLLNTLVFFVSVRHRFGSHHRSKTLQLAPKDLKVVGAQFTQLITSIMISRLFLNLRSVTDTTRDGYSTTGGPTGHTASRLVSGAVGNLGEELDVFER